MKPRLIWRRLRHSRGFGIHSPFAYRFVTEVLHQPCAYYAYKAVPEDVMSRHQWELLVRLIVFFRPKVIAFGPKVPSTVGRFLHKVSPRVTFTGQPDLLIAFGEIPQEFAERVESGGMHAIILNSKSMPEVGLREHGMVFGNGKCWVMAAYQHLPAQNFDVYF